MKTNWLQLLFQKLTPQFGVFQIFTYGLGIIKMVFSKGDSPNNGTWDNSSEVQKLNANNDGTFSISFVPNEFLMILKFLGWGCL